MEEYKGQCIDTDRMLDELLHTDTPSKGPDVPVESRTA